MPATLTTSGNPEERLRVEPRLARAPRTRLVLPDGATGLPAAIDVPFREAIVGVDFSPASIAAARIALGLVHGDGSLTLVHVMDPWPLRTSLSSADALGRLHDYEARAATASERLLGLLPQEPDGRLVESLVGSGTPHSMLLRAAREAKADLIGLGVAVDAAAHEPRLGPTARAVLRRARCAVLLVFEPRRKAGSRREALDRGRHAHPTRGLSWFPGEAVAS